jgi:hypothetical protein
VVEANPLPAVFWEGGGEIELRWRGLCHPGQGTELGHVPDFAARPLSKVVVNGRRRPVHNKMERRAFGIALLRVVVEKSRVVL